MHAEVKCEFLLSVNATPSIRRARAADLGHVRFLLSEAQLPTADLDTAPGLRCWVLELGDELIGTIGLECAGNGALVRSLTIAKIHRGQGWGRALLSALEREARSLDIRQLVLLTETAQPFFAAHGYAVIDRRYVPEELKHSAEFQSLCPVSAVCMTKSLEHGDG